ncbi:MAG TPA: glutamate-5-semialdehyde dehydrogenase [Candidatus Fimenecus excrementigallinarum]|uniref:Gamma-glutamyl phosphate reductase n=1 Tax=Candidatus Fimenecus excrementigallinarum TaxID=2840816 RepID=A0A9D1IFU7_9FIRM|nr:glutamate-5-semialdehyde dehydrogenase [Candidatus Fimenecus excrementigallinarum]
MNALETLGARAKQASRTLMTASTETKNRALAAAAQALLEAQDAILAENAKDLAKAREVGMASSMLDRLALDPGRLAGMAKGLLEVAELPDPVGVTLSEVVRPNGLRVRKVSVPMGVIAVIFEARPNVSADAAALCLKSGNAVILRGGKEAVRSNAAIVNAMRGAVERAGLPADCICLVEDTSRESARALMRLNDYVDVLIPRGGAGLIHTVVANATVPVIETGVGNCHIYIDRDADLAMAADIVYNAKTSRVSVCNAAESLLVHEAVAEAALPAVYKRLAEKQVTLYGDARAQEILPGIEKADESDWGREYLDYKMSVKVVGSLDEAVAHIAKYSSGHSDCIVTENAAAAERFLNEVDSAAVYWNASTRFTDGGCFGFGAEIGISTQKLHARGPLGLPQLTSFKYQIYGDGQVR